MDHGPIGDENEDPMDVDAPPSPTAAEPSPDATRPSPMDDDDSDDNDITLDQMREKARIRREASPEALREADQASRMERLKKQRERDARDLERKATELPIAKREKDEAKQKLKELTRQKSALENELRKAREGGVSRSLLPSLDLPEPRGRLPIAEELMAPALLAWDCAQTFNDKLSLCRYSFDDYAHAVSGPENSVLLIETVRGMLRMVLKEGLVGLDEEDAADEAAAEAAEAKAEEEEQEDAAEEEDSYEEEEEEEEDEEEAEPEPVYQGRKRKKVDRLGHSATPPAKKRPPRSARRRRSIAQADTVTPSNWESMLRRSLRSCVHVAAGKRDAWFSSAAGAHQARRSMKETPFCSLPSDQKVSAMAVLALAVYRTQACRKALVARKSAEESWAKEEKKKQKQARKDADSAKAQLKKEALEKIKKERAERAKLLGDKAPIKAADIKEKEITAKMNAMSKERALGGRKVLAGPPDDEPISDDEEELDTEEDGLKTSERKKRQATNQAIRRRNKNRVSRRYEREKRDKYRESAFRDLRAALQSGDIKLLKNALKSADRADLMGDEGGPDDEPWCITPVADALRKLASANPAHTMCTYEMRQTRDEVGGRTNTGVRREPLGIDRTGTRYYDFDEKDEDHGLCRVFAQTLVEAPPPKKVPPTPGGVTESVSELPQQLRETSEWKCYASKQEVKALYRALDDAFEEERDLKNALADRYHADRPDEGDNGWLKEGNEALGCIIAKKYGRQFKQGVVTGFVPEGFEEQDGDVQQMDLWHVEIDDGDSEDFEAHELEAGRDTHNRSFRRYTNMAQGDKMHDYRECRNEVYNQFGGTGRRDLEQAGYSAAQLDDLLD
ncbi:unnamed protein product [Pelagomonas calceolata]|uniref:DDT domain-containing protein n=2 Tax=Pelagomonas calceolata TaxID=35677 RepID=A0A7S4E8T5_9STRA|nr:unnamed protein product [Pelagomonas calceolata]|mmetsp:Transcript_11681/g.34448  ORF Transcript_11681/g.34448 Transcript_11681/m.34448 type:complete len:848 (+) Transcript_11681:174-2717(+)